MNQDTIKMVEFCLSTNQLGYLGAGAALLYALKRLITRIPIDSVLSETASGPHSQLLVVVTGSTKGIGLSMCKEFLRKNDLVVVSSRNENHVKNAVENLKKEHSGSQIVGKTADVTKEEEMLELCDFASAYFGKPVDVFICNAGITQQKKNPITQVSENEIEQIILTNLVGAINGYKAAAMNMQKNNKTSKGHIFLMEGAGSLGRATPNFASYGVSKAGYLQLLKSLKAEAKEIGVSVHTISPGMVITDLLLGSASGAFAYKIFNILAEMPETVSAYLVPRIRGIARTKKSGLSIRFLTMPSVIWRFLTAALRKNRLIDEKTGNIIVNVDQQKHTWFRFFY